MKVNLIGFVIILLLAAFPFSHKANALSEYGLKCDDNESCVACRTDLKCIKCMHNCWNNYYYADSDLKTGMVRSKAEACRLKRAKWCNAQCWDPDDTEDPAYVSTKPDCDAAKFYSIKGGMKKIQERSDVE